MIDKIFIRQLRCKGIIGCEGPERERPQDIWVNLVLQVDLGAAARTDNLRETVDYALVSRRVMELVEHSEFFLLEKLAQAIADVCLEFEMVLAVMVAVEKPSAVPQAAGVGVELFRSRM